MDTAKIKLTDSGCPDEGALGAYLDGTLDGALRDSVETHIASCDACLTNMVSAYESVAEFKNKQKGNIMKKINLYFIGMVISFTLSFIFPAYFLQLLVATIICGAKWIIDARSTRMLVMIYDAWRKGGEKEASRILEKLKPTSRI